MKGQAVSALSAALISGCGFVHDETIIGPYHLVAIDVDEQMAICYSVKDGCVGRVPATVFATGFSAAYVVAARHPVNDRAKTEYYYLIRSLDGDVVDASVTVKGPFDASGFKEEKARLGLPDFSKHIDSLK